MIIGIDPGQSGGAVLLGSSGLVLDTLVFSKATEHDIAECLNSWRQEDGGGVIAFLESVHSMPKQGVASSFKFGRSFGFLIGVLTALKIRYELVTPQKWQKALHCLSHGDKNVTKASAQRRWPDRKWTHAIADAALIAEYGRSTAP